MSNQTLSNQFNTILTQYQNTYKSFIDSVNSSNNNLVSVPNTLFTAKNTISISPNSSSKSCKKSCLSNASCSGATIDANNNCTLSSGTGNIITSSDTTSFVPESVSYIYQLQGLNEQLISINQQIMNTSNNDAEQYQQDEQNNSQKKQMLQQNYQTLTQERDNIDKMLREFETLDSAYDNGTIVLTSNYYNYIALLLISILLAFMLMKFSTMGQQQTGGGNNFKKESLFLLGIMIVFLGLSKVFKDFNSYIFVSILLFAYLLAKIKLNQ
jgi:hypothetical protein